MVRNGPPSKIVAETSDNTQHSQQPDIHAPGGIRTHYLSRRAPADPYLRTRGHWDRLFDNHVCYI